MSVILYAAVLRFDAISQQFDPVATPHWLSTLQRSRQGPSVVRPPMMRWPPFPRFPHRDGPPTQYRSDPYTYLQRAREMTSFYGAHLREPLFPFTTKIALLLLNNQDVAVSVASAFYSLLAVLGTCALGTIAFSFPVGVGAALLLAIEYDVITTGTQGWRDDAYTCMVVWFCAGMLWFMRRPSNARAVAFGAVAAAACLVRITAISFLVPAGLWMLVTGRAQWRLHVRRLSVAAVVTAVLVSPYIVNCWRAFGDPLYAINTHADRYASMEDSTLDTAALGMTVYPFANKWTGFAPWGRATGRVLEVAALLGLAVFLTIPAGRLLLVVVAACTVPYAFTWRLPSDWRFTEPAYPFLLIASCAAIATVAHLLRDQRGTLSAVSRFDVIVAGAVLTVIAAAVFSLTRITPVLVFEEQLASGEPATVFAGVRDGSFFSATDWPHIAEAGTVTTRWTTTNRASVELPLRKGAAYTAVIRIDPSPLPVAGASVPPIQLLLNGRLLGSCQTDSRPDRIGACHVEIEPDAVGPRKNRLTFVSEHASGFRIWYIRVQRR